MATHPIEKLYRALGGVLGLGALGLGGYFAYRALHPYFNAEDGDEPSASPLALESGIDMVDTGRGTKQVQGWRRGQPQTIEVKEVQRGYFLNVDGAADAFIEMSAAAMSENGIALRLNTAFRTMPEQQRLYDLWKAGRGNKAALPGWSNHQWGTASDIESASGTNEAFHWLTANASRFRFKRTVASEPWHWEYV